MNTINKFTKYIGRSFNNTLIDSHIEYHLSLSKKGKPIITWMAFGEPKSAHNYSGMLICSNIESGAWKLIEEPHLDYYF